jgi:glycine cleavage system aminomethyltransferase T
MLNEFGKLIGDFTIAKRAEDRFMIWGSSGRRSTTCAGSKSTCRRTAPSASTASTRRWSG